MLVLTKRRVDHRWSKGELARRARMTPADAGKIESGRLVPYPSQLVKLAVALGLAADRANELMGVAER